MKHSFSLFLTVITLLFAPAAFSCFSNQPQCKCTKEDECCAGMGGISYCDSSAGFFVCKNGDYSACYCTRHAVMDLQNISGCCLWHGGIASADQFGRIFCRDGTYSQTCSIQLSSQIPVSSW